MSPRLLASPPLPRFRLWLTYKQPTFVSFSTPFSTAYHMARDEDLYSSQPAYDLFLSQASGSGVKWQQEKSRLRDELLSEAEIGQSPSTVLEAV